MEQCAVGHRHNISVGQLKISLWSNAFFSACAVAVGGKKDTAVVLLW